MIDTLKSVVHLQNELGDDLFKVLISSDNTKAVLLFAQGLLHKGLPDEMTIGNRRYEILSPLQTREITISGYTLLIRAKELNANLGQGEGEYILQHQDEIPASLHEILFIFPNWPDPDKSESAHYVTQSKDRWTNYSCQLNYNKWGKNVKLLRRKTDN